MSDNGVVPIDSRSIQALIMARQGVFAASHALKALQFDLYCAAKLNPSEWAIDLDVGAFVKIVQPAPPDDGEDILLDKK